MTGAAAPDFSSWAALCAITPGERQEAQDCLNACSAVIGEQFPGRVGTEERIRVVEFNDHEETTVEDVLLVLGKVASG